MTAADLLRRSIAETERSLSAQRAALAEIEAADNLGDAAAGNWISIAEAARLLGVTKNAVWKRLKARQIEATFKGRRAFVFYDDLQKLYDKSPANLATPPANLASFRDAIKAPILNAGKGVKHAP
jgi:excisionase family DNA binding protein